MKSFLFRSSSPGESHPQNRVTGGGYAKLLGKPKFDLFANEIYRIRLF